ncbi:MAG TPA: 23S rRNA (uracil(1939)-C(5))-methyltransferase RlmD [Firmicutes bacterium]|nr:23S rRNA (uracil(1939)-C(5))-methyltransferase RlmD [Bacillota bacterium]
MGDILELEIQDLNHAGEGVGRHGGNGRVVFVPYAAPGDVVRARIIADKGGYMETELLSVVKESGSRVPPPCPVYLQCGGCQLQHISYEAQLEYKTRRVRQALERIGKIKDARVKVKECLPAPQQFHYRNKARYSYESRPHMGFFSGFYARRTRNVVDFNECIIQNHINNKIFQALNDLAREFDLPAYDPGSYAQHPTVQGIQGVQGVQGMRGALRHLVARTSGDGREALAVLVTYGGALPGIDALARGLMERVPELVGVVEDVGGRVFATSTNRRAPGPHLVAGRDWMTEHIQGLEFRVSAESFLQVNPAATELLYSVILSYADLTGEETVLDAYSGIGTISLLLARRARHVYGIEVVKAATRNARENASLNGLRNCTFFTGRVEDVLKDKNVFGSHAGKEPGRGDIVVVDPPRPGCDKGAIAGIVALAPRSIIYVSCNPETLARDLARLAKADYQTVEVQPVDMFPQTAHVECCALLQKPKTVITIA